MNGPVVGPVLGIETSCDETAAAVLAPDGHVMAEAVLSQQEHAAFGGVVPEIAARAHLAHLPSLVRDTMARAGIGFADLGGVAATSGPGLIGGLIVGAGFGKGVALAHRLPFVAVNHLEAHALTARLPGLVEGGLAFPYLLLLVSGGHCQCVAVEGVGRFTRLGGTIDDAVGEAFDKVAKLLGLGWPGGPALERLASGGDPARFPLPRPLLGRPGCDFSFSGLKTAVAQLVATFPPGALRERDAADIAASFQHAVADVLADRADHAMQMFAARHASRSPLVGLSREADQGRGEGSLRTDFGAGCTPHPTLSHKGTGLLPHPAARTLVVAGGVAANATLRAALANAAARHGFTLVAPPLKLCGDNAVMVAWAGIERLRLGLADPLDHAPRPRWPLTDLAA